MYRKLSKQILDLVKDSKNIVILGHRRPDGDAIGSIIGMRSLLWENVLGNVSLVVPDEIPDNLRWMPYLEDIKIYSENPETVEKLIKKSDVLIACDFSVLPRLGNNLEEIVRSASPKIKICIDHHENPDTDFWDFLVSRPEYSSTSEIVSEIIDIEVCPTSVRTCLETGIITDTKNLQRTSYTSNPLKIIEQLEKYGSMGRESINKLALHSRSLEATKLRSYILFANLEVIPEHQVGIITLEKYEADKFGYRLGMLEGLAETVLEIYGVRYCFFFRDEPGTVKITARSNDKFPVVEICRDLYNGGGHLDRAGADWNEGTVQEAKQKLIDNLSNYDKYL